MSQDWETFKKPQQESADKNIFKKLTSTQSEHGNQVVDAKQFMALEPGYLLGEHKEFRLVKHLGNGGMGVTWLADALDSKGEKKQSVVCKILSKELINDAKAIQNVLDVFDLTKNLNHTNICPLLDRIEDSVFKHVLVMRYAEGETLEEWFLRQPGYENGLPIQTVLPILQQVASALDAMHLRKIIHRDVKPQNIIFSTRNTAFSVPWLIDFGIAQAVNDSDPEQNRRKSGTPIFMAPEQHYGKPQDARTDQYALAVTAFWLLTGNSPFTADSQEELSGKKMFPQSSLNPVASTLKPTFLRALAYEPKDRFASCSEFVNALTQQKTSQTPPPAPISEPSDPFADILKTAEQKREEGRKRAEKELAEKKNRLVDSARKAYADEDFPLAKKYVDELLALDPKNPHYLQFRDFIQQQLDAIRSPTLKAGDRMVKTVNGIEYAFRWCPAGTFTMGSPSSESGRDNDETQHSVTLTRGFWMLETEVTQAMWKSVMGENPSYFKGWLFSKDQNPVEQVRWEDCQTFCGKLSSKLGMTVSLPTEAQWEYACRAGTTGAYAGDLDAMGWYTNNSGGKTHPVGQKKPNAWGLYDMHGNVWEWCSDWYGEDYYTESPTSDPTGPNSGSDRVRRGGSWYRHAEYCRSADRNYYGPGNRDGDLGFRIVLADPVPGN